MDELGWASAFLAGMLSFASPCVLPMLPTYSAILADGENSSRLYRNALCFLTGFTLVFVLLGATATLLGQWLWEWQDVLRHAGAVLMVILGIFLAGLWQPRRLMTEYRPLLKRRSGGAIGSLLLGMAFSIGWTPCTGPILAAILLYASQRGTAGLGAALLLVYSLGFAVPFFLLAVLWRQYLSRLRLFYAWLPKIQIAAGICLIVLGILLWFDGWRQMLGWIYSLG